MAQKINIKLKSFDHRLLDQSVKEIVNTVLRSGGSGKYQDGVFGVFALPLPRKIKKFTVNRSPHVNKTSRDQYEIRKMKRLISINRPTAKVIDALVDIDLAAGVEVNIKSSGV